MLPPPMEERRKKRKRRFGHSDPCIIMSSWSSISCSVSLSGSCFLFKFTPPLGLFSAGGSPWNWCDSVDTIVFIIVLLIQECQNSGSLFFHIVPFYNWDRYCLDSRQFFFLFYRFLIIWWLIYSLSFQYVDFCFFWAELDSKESSSRLSASSSSRSSTGPSSVWFSDIFTKDCKNSNVKEKNKPDVHRISILDFRWWFYYAQWA